jgi:hypothetical protein
MGIEGVELSKTDKRQTSYITIDVFKIMIYSQCQSPEAHVQQTADTEKRGSYLPNLKKAHGESK